MTKTLKHIITLLTISCCLSSCAKKYTCVCEHPTMANSQETHKFRSQDQPTAMAFCQSYENGGLICELE